MLSRSQSISSLGIRRSYRGRKEVLLALQSLFPKVRNATATLSAPGDDWDRTPKDILDELDRELTYRLVRILNRFVESQIPYDNDDDELECAQQ
jgi:hypothetical protein